jgi:hypothetical protein
MLATVTDCEDSDLLARLARLLEDLGLKYIPYVYAANKIYQGQCRGLRGFSWANPIFCCAWKLTSSFAPKTTSYRAAFFI